MRIIPMRHRILGGWAFMLVAALGGCGKSTGSTGASTCTGGSSGTEPDASSQAPETILVAINETNGLGKIFEVGEGGALTERVTLANQNENASSGMIKELRVSADGKFIYFVSDFAYLYTPLSQNVFRAAYNGSNLRQLTPTSGSGNWGQTCATPGTVVVTVKSNGISYPCSGASVMIEGVKSPAIASSASDDCTVTFTGVPSGTRGVIAYQSGQVANWDFDKIVVVDGLTTSVTLTIRAGGTRTAFYSPIPFGDDIYVRLGPYYIDRFRPGEITYSDNAQSGLSTIYTAPTLCSDFTGLEGFDVSRTTGKFAIIDRATGCGTSYYTENNKGQGLYVTAGPTAADVDARTLKLDMLTQGVTWTVNGGTVTNNNGWCSGTAAQHVYWSPDETRIAFLGCNYDVTGGTAGILFVYNVASNTFSAAALSVDVTKAALYGWNASGSKLLYATWTQSDGSDGQLFSVDVQTDGTIVTSTVATRLTNRTIGSAAWAPLMK